MKTKTKTKKTTSLSKRVFLLFLIMTIVIIATTCIIGYVKYSSSITKLYNDNSYSIANIVRESITPEMADFLESTIVYKTDSDGKAVLNEHDHKIPVMQKNEDGSITAATTFDMYADPSSLEGEDLEKYNKYQQILKTLDTIRDSSGAKYIFLCIPCDGDETDDPYYEEGQNKYANPYAVYLADARYSDETLQELNLTDETIIETAKSFGINLTSEDIRDPSGRIYDNVYDAYCRLGLGMQSRLAPEIYSDALDVFMTGNRSNNYFENTTEFGTTTEALLPFRNSYGKTVGMIAVDVEMTIIRSTLTTYLTQVITLTFVIVLLFVGVLLIYLNKHVIKPVQRITQATSEFVSGNMQVPENLANIKTQDEIQQLAQSVMTMSGDILDYIKNLENVTAEKERIGAELNIATHIQSSMLPCIFPAFPDRNEFDIFATMTPAKEVGGDFYDFFMIDDTHLAIVVADVSGKGVPAALFMVIGKTLIKDHSTPNCDLGQVFTDVNNILCESNSEGLFITAFEGVLDLVTGEFRFVNAGHEMPCILKANGSYEAYPVKAGFVLAGMENIKYKLGSIMLEPGDKLFQYTDGVTEATDANNQLFGMERMLQSLNNHKNASPSELLPAIKADIDAFVGDAPQFDDITMLSLEYKARMEKPEKSSNNEQ